jgi:3-oxosteroid 1-dehydrogenase
MKMTDEATAWDHEYDVVVVGSGNGGMTAALTAKLMGLDVLLIEKMPEYGGSSALSGGALWIPNNAENVRTGVKDSPERARQYLRAIIGDAVTEERIDAFVDNGPEMYSFIESHTPWFKYKWIPGYADYHPEDPGGAPRGRTVEPVPLNAKLLGADDQLYRSDVMKVPHGLWMTGRDYRLLTQIMRTWAGRATAMKVGIKSTLSRVLRRQMVSLGAAGVARLRLALRDAKVPLWLDTPLESLVTEGGSVVGIEVTRSGAPTRIRARRGVVLAAGGFERNAEMRREYQQEPINGTWTSGAVGNTGDGIRAGMAIGAAVALMDDAWWGPGVLFGDRSLFLLAERTLPGSIVVNGIGERYVNEAAPYVNFVHTMYDGHASGVPHIPSYLIFDQTFRNRYPLMGTAPRRPIPAIFYDQGAVFSADTIPELAEQLGLPPDGLGKTVARWNELVAGGRDLDFHTGDSAYDRYYADPTITPNPCLSPIDKGPYYGMPLVPGDLGTKGGLLTDEHARVLREDGTVIDGLFATGNCAASVMGHEYPGAGGTLAPAMVFGYIAAKFIAQQSAAGGGRGSRAAVSRG